MTTMQNLAAYCIIFSFTVYLASGCHSNIKEHVKKLQKDNPQGCMQCKELKLSKLCESSTLSNSQKVCGKASINYHMVFTKQNCGRAVVHCSAKPPKLSHAVIAVDNPFLNSTFNNSTDEMELNTSLLVEEMQRDDFFDVELDGFLYISPEKRTSTSATVICNDKSEWEATTNDGRLVTGITQVHCIVGKSAP